MQCLPWENGYGVQRWEQVLLDYEGLTETNDLRSRPVPVPAVRATQAADALATECLAVLGQHNIEQVASIAEAGALKGLKFQTKARYIRQNVK